MGLFDFLKREEPVKKGSIIANLAFWESLEGSEYTSLADSPEVMTAIKAIARLVSSMTIQLMENTEKGDRRVKNELSRKVDIEPYSLTTRKNFIEYITTQMVLNGNCIVIPKYGGYSDEGNLLLKDLVPIESSGLAFQPTKNGYIVARGTSEYNHADILNFVLNPSSSKLYEGDGYRTRLKDIVKNLQQARATTNAFMKSQFMPSVIVKVDSTNEELLTKDGREILKDRLMTTNKGEPAIVPSDIVDIQVVTPLSLKDIAIHESLELDTKTVANLLGVPSFVLGVGEFDKDAFNNFISTTIREFAQIIEQELTRKLLISPNLYFRMSIRSLYAYSISDMVSAGIPMVEHGAMYRNELRDWVGLEYREEMEPLLMLENYLNVDDLSLQKKLIQDDKGGE